ncbi:MAG: PHP domain-containing protein, partial [Acidimicrobiia bacterium]
LTLRGFGPKTQKKIAEAIEFFRAQDTRWLLPKAMQFAEMLREHLEELAGIEQVAVAGSIRRRLEIVRNVNLCIVASDLAVAAHSVMSVDFLDRAEQVDPTSIRAQSRTAMPVAVRLCTADEFPTALLFTTGSAPFVESIVAHAGRKGFVLAPEGLTRSGKRIALSSESEVFEKIGIATVEPELREEPPRNLRPRPRLIDVSDLRGAFHVHNTFSDGKATVYEMLEAASLLGLAYVGMSDHSPTAYYARGLTEERLAEQHAEIDQHARSFSSMRIFKGTESDILGNGDLDYPPEILAKLDFVVASVHSRFKMGSEEMTERILRAIRNPFTTFLGHLTGRRLLSREGYRVDYDAVFAAAAKEGVILEINGNPNRLDLD